MIRSNILSNYPNHRSKLSDFSTTIFVMDYTNGSDCKKDVEISCQAPTNCAFLTIKNQNALSISTVKFNSNSFKVRQNGHNKFRSQCECAVFPHTSDSKSWMLFAELKYCLNRNNKVNLDKACCQLFKTRGYYLKEKPVFYKTNPCYLIVSLPEQSAPFTHTGMAQSYLIKLKSKYNIILRVSNFLEVLDDKRLSTL